VSADAYARFSRFTDPGAWAAQLENLPDDPIAICKIAERQTIHHNLLGYFGLGPDHFRSMRRVWPPRVPDMLDAISELPPGDLVGDRRPEHRILGACVLESHFLAGLLRAKGIPTRIRAGYFQGIRENHEHIVAFWRGALGARATDDELLRTDPDRWQAELDAYSQHLNDIDHHIEHWLCEVRDEDTGEWRLLDANRSFLKAHSDLDVDYELPPEHFEFAWQAWQRMRADPAYDPDRHAEEPQDGRSHIRSQLLSDFASLLNHDLAGFAEPDEETHAFVRGQSFDATAPEELADLDALADLLSTDPSVEQLADFHRTHPRLRIPAAETDSYSFAFSS